MFEPAPDSRLRANSCFVLSPHGLERAGAIKEVVGLTSLFDPTGRPIADFAALSEAVPNWDPGRKGLWLGDLLVKRFRRPARDQELVLAAFQEQGWAPRIDDPLPPRAGRDAAERLHDTINHLNRSRTHCLIHFRHDGTGKGLPGRRC